MLCCFPLPFSIIGDVVSQPEPYRALVYLTVRVHSDLIRVRFYGCVFFANDGMSWDSARGGKREAGSEVVSQTPLFNF